MKGGFKVFSLKSFQVNLHISLQSQKARTQEGVLAIGNQQHPQRLGMVGSADGCACGVVLPFRD